MKPLSKQTISLIVFSNTAWSISAHTHTHTWPNIDCKNTEFTCCPLCFGNRCFYLNWSSNCKNPLNLCCQTKCAWQPDLKLGDRSRGRATILVMCWVLFQAAGTGLGGRNWKWICQDGIKVQLEYLAISPSYRSYGLLDHVTEGFEGLCGAKLYERLMQYGQVLMASASELMSI